MSANESSGEKCIVSLSEFDPRPEECNCPPQFEDLPCWPCYRAGFETPNPDATEDE